jgi:hypothetical protein
MEIIETDKKTENQLKEFTWSYSQLICTDHSSCINMFSSVTSTAQLKTSIKYYSLNFETSTAKKFTAYQICFAYVTF